jgi:Tannase-like family of unknown function (DUF6351)
MVGHRGLTRGKVDSTMRHRVLLGMIALAATGAGVLPIGAASATPREPIEVIAVSNPHPDLVSGGDVLVRVVVTAGVGADRVAIDLNGTDVTPAFAAQADGSLLGLVTGLRHGSNVIRAQDANRRGPTALRSGFLRVVDHPITGPVFSGPQQVPFFCETQAFGLPAATPPLCSAPTQVSYVYRTTAGAFAPLVDPSLRPADLATATVNGGPVPYIVRIERGTIDRAVYEMAALYDGRAPGPLAPDTSWNGTLVYTFGGGCNAGYHQGASTAGVVNDDFLRKGYGVASSSLNVLDNNCSTIISAEAAMMVKEHFAETYGALRHTIGWGGSGGAIQQYDIADAYPGILDGIVPGVSFPDPFSTIGPVTDCRLLNRYFASATVAYTDAQKTAIAGFGTYHPCVSWDSSFANRVTATDSCDPAVPVGARWDPVSNPDGVKCAAVEQYVNQLGRDPLTGFVRAVLDNRGVQYGLAALAAGTITAEQFVDLNEHMGGYDVAGAVVPTRTAADSRGVRVAYQDDMVNSGGLGLATTPIIDHRTYLDNVPSGSADIHTEEWSYVMRQRMIEAGTAANQVIIESRLSQIGSANTYALDAMDRWLTAIDADRSPRPLQAKVASDRPADLGDGCFLLTGARILEPLSYGGTGQCASQYPVFANPRLAAGEPLTRDVLECRRQLIDFSSYPVTFTAGQQARLWLAFPDGVCDYSRPGVGQQPPRGTWIDYGAAPAR